MESDSQIFILGTEVFKPLCISPFFPVTHSLMKVLMSIKKPKGRQKKRERHILSINSESPLSTTQSCERLISESNTTCS